VAAIAVDQIAVSTAVTIAVVASTFIVAAHYPGRSPMFCDKFDLTTLAKSAIKITTAIKICLISRTNRLFETLSWLN
jgi:hypothetical protein